MVSADIESEVELEVKRLMAVSHDQEFLLKHALELVGIFNDAVNKADQKMHHYARVNFRAVILAMNGGTHFGCCADDNSPGNLVLKHCRARAGLIPMWGQCGEFIITVEGVRAFVSVENWMADLTTMHLVFTVVDLDKPFISETGYRSHFTDYNKGFGSSVQAFVMAEFKALIQERKRLVMLDAEHAERLSKTDLPQWCNDVSPPPQRASQVPPAGYVLVDCILPEYQAVIARQWAAAAEEKLKKKAEGALDKNSGEPPKSVERPAVSDNAKTTVAAVNKNKFRPGQVCKVVRVHCANPALEQYKQSKLGQEVVIAKLLQSGTSVWAYDNVPARYRINQRGNRTCDYDPSCIQDLYDINDLEIVEGKEHATKSLISYEN